MPSHFFAYISKIRWIQRWGLKRNVVKENVMEHSWEVASIAHALAVIKNEHYGANLDVNAVVVAALYHDCSEVITGDMPSPVKYHSRAITESYKAIERQAEHELLALLPERLQPHYRPFLIEHELPAEHAVIIKSADTIAAYIKCKMEITAGNSEFAKAAEALERRLAEPGRPEVEHFLRTFVPSYSLTLDELLAGSLLNT